MVAQNVVFGILAVVMVVAAFRLVTTQNVVRAALFLAIVLAGAAGLYILLAAEFVAWVQVLVYIGAVVVLLLFGVMLTRAPIGRDADLDNEQRLLERRDGHVVARDQPVLPRGAERLRPGRRRVRGSVLPQLGPPAGAVGAVVEAAWCKTGRIDSRHGEGVRPLLPRLQQLLPSLR